MRVLGIDYGSKNVGIAISDENAQFAMPHIVLKNSKELVKEIKELTKKNSINEIVLGESRNYKGEENVIFKKSMEFKKALENEGLIVYFEPEFMTSVQAQKLQGKNDKLDASAAALILQSFLDKKAMKG